MRSLFNYCWFIVCILFIIFGLTMGIKGLLVTHPVGWFFGAFLFWAASVGTYCAGNAFMIWYDKNKID